MHLDQKENKNGLSVMLGLIGMVKPLIAYMAAAIAMGCIGNLMAAFITILGAVGIGSVLGYFTGISMGVVFALILIVALLRGILRYAEQASNHYIAFRLLAKIRGNVFAALRKLAPAKLDGSEKGNLITIITSDIELLEVFYAHTISPVVIAVLTSVFMCLFIGYFSPVLGILAGVFYLIVGVVIPVINSRQGLQYGIKYRQMYGSLNTLVLDNFYGLSEILQYGRQKERLQKMNSHTQELEKQNRILKKKESYQRIASDSVILTAGITILAIGGFLTASGRMQGGEVLLCTVAMMSSFGPTAALAALSNNLSQTLASGRRVLELLKEAPQTAEINSSILVPEGDIHGDKVTFSYGDEDILQNFSVSFEKNKIHGILGKSGCGKSTLLKLLMRFYETDGGEIRYAGQNVNEIDTKALQSHISYVTQETFLFQDTIENNIKIADEAATREEVIEAAKKASLHDFIASLPMGYDTKISELGESLSGGEKQRVGVARAFLHKSKVILLDEPTSNLDSLNEGILIKSLQDDKENRTIILVSHRKSTMGIAERVTAM